MESHGIVAFRGWLFFSEYNSFEVHQVRLRGVPMAHSTLLRRGGPSHDSRAEVCLALHPLNTSGFLSVFIWSNKAAMNIHGQVLWECKFSHKISFVGMYFSGINPQECNCWAVW